MSEPTAFTDLEEGLYGPDGTAVLRRTAGNLRALRDRVQSARSAGLSPDHAESSVLVLNAIDAAERILIHLKRSGE